MGLYSSRFSFSLGTVLEVQALGLTGVTDVEVTGVVMKATQIEPKRTGEVTITLDNEDYEFTFELHAEPFNQVSILGKPLVKTPR